MKIIVKGNKIIKRMKKFFAVLLCMAVIAGMSVCSSVNSGKRIVRISHAQSETHPEHLGLLEFKKYIEENLGEKYEVQIDTPDDMKGLKIRVQQSQASVNMVKAFGAAAARLSTEVEMAAWDDQVEAAKEIAQNEMGVEFIDVDVEVFKDKVANVQQEMLDANPDIQDIYDHIQKINEEYKEAE